MKILLIDDHRLFNDGLKELLLKEIFIEEVIQIYDSREALQCLQTSLIDLVLLDFNLPHINGLELTILIQKNFPNIPIIILSMYAEKSQIEEFKKVGAKGYLLKTVEITELSTAIKDVYAGKIFFPNTTKQNNHNDDDFLKKFRLTQREFEVIQLIKAGNSTTEIANKLCISSHTIITHRKNIHLKLGIQNERELIKFATENNI